MPWWDDFPILNNQKDEKGIIKFKSSIYWYVIGLEHLVGLLGIIDVFHDFIDVKLYIFMKRFISLLFLWTCYCIGSNTWLSQALCKLIKNKKLKRMYHFEGWVAHHDEYIVQGIFHTPL